MNARVDFRYASGIEVRSKFPGDWSVPRRGPFLGGIFVGEKCKIEINRNKFMSNPIEIRDELLKKVDEAEEEVKWSDQTALWQAKWQPGVPSAREADRWKV